MLNFKQYLKENEIDLKPFLHIWINVGTPLQKDYREFFEKKFENNLKIPNLRYINSYSIGGILFEYDLDKENAGNIQKINAIIEKIKGKVNLVCQSDKRFKNNQVLNYGDNISVVLYDVPDFMIDFTDISIVNKNKISLHGIDKVISQNCTSFTVNYSDKITDSVLGLLKLPKKCEILIPRRNDWDKIVSKYLDSRDIIACSEELIEAGYKEYAKL